MTTKECYEKIGSNYESVLSRFGNEALVKRFALKFLKDPSYAELKEALEAHDAERAFRAAHTLKGVCLNLGFDRLYETSAPSPKISEEEIATAATGYSRN